MARIAPLDVRFHFRQSRAELYKADANAKKCMYAGTLNRLNRLNPKPAPKTQNVRLGPLRRRFCQNFFR